MKVLKLYRFKCEDENTEYSEGWYEVESKGELL